MKKSAYDKVTEAQERAAQLNDIDEVLADGSAGQTDLYVSNKTVGKVVDVLESICVRSNNLVCNASLAADKMRKLGHELEEVTRNEKPKSDNTKKLGQLMRRFNADAREYDANPSTDKTEELEKILEAATPIVENILRTACAVCQATDYAVKHTSENIIDVARRTALRNVNSARNVANAMIAQSANLTSQLTDKVSSTFNTIYAYNKNKAKKVIHNVMKDVATFPSDTVGSAKNVIDRARLKANELLAQAESDANDIKEDARSENQAMINQVVSIAQTLMGTEDGNNLARNVLMEFGLGNYDLPPVYRGIGELFKNAYDSVKSGAKKAVEAASDLTSSVSNKLSNAANSLVTGASNVANKLATAGKNLVSNILGTTANTSGGDNTSGEKTESEKGFLDKAKDYVKSLTDKAKDTGSKIWDKVKEAVQTATNPSTEPEESSGLIDGIKNFIKDKLGVPKGEDNDNLGQDLEDATDDLTDGIADDAEDMADDVLDTAADEADDDYDDTMDDADDFIDDLEDDYDDIDDAVDDMENDWDDEDWDDDPEDDDDYPDEDDEDDDDYPDDEDDEDDDDDTPDWNDDWGDEPDPSEDSSTTTPMSSSSSPSDRGLQAKPDRYREIGWKSFEAEIPEGIIGMMHDGDQQLLNPYGKTNGDWTMYSFRPHDTLDVEGDEPFPQIAITPASYEAIESMDTMLDNIPYVVVKEFFFKNTASTMMNFVKKIMGMVQEMKEGSPNPDEDKPGDNSDEASSQGSDDTKSTGNKLLDKIKEKFEDIKLKQSAIDLPYVLYCGLRKKLYGNTYIFPYIATSSTIINKASNDAEWNGKSNFVKDMIQGIASMAGGLASLMMGSQAQAANLFPAPTWGGSDGGDKVSFSFDLILINDNIVKARNNYMCVNTIIHNNRSIQKALLAFPGALYEVWLPTGQRHLMCTGDFQLYPLGLNRKVPTGFFKGSVKGANFQIGTSNGDVAQLENPHKIGHIDEVEVVPDAYKLTIKFQSCLPNNMNTAVFQYYVKMTDYNNYTGAPHGGEESQDSVFDKTAGWVQTVMGSNDYNENANNNSGGDSTPPSGGSTQDGDNKSMRAATPRPLEDEFSSAAVDLVESIEKFDESTYNKKLEKIKTSMGDQNITTDSAVLTIKGAQRVIRESNEFLSKLYNANNTNLWYKEYDQDEIYTTMKPDYRQVLRKQYREKLKEVRKVDSEMKEREVELDKIQRELSTKLELSERDDLLVKRVSVVREINALKTKRDAIADEMIRKDIDLIQIAFDEHDRAVSVKKTQITPRIFKQVWNEKIMNSYEKDKLQYLTSYEKARYFQEKIRELEKYDQYGILNHKDWFFRVTVLDYIIMEMQRLIYWFKNCSYNDFETVYRIVRKLRMLQLDVESVRSKEAFDINRTNLFYLSNEDLKDFTKIDGMLQGNSLYELFQSQMSFKFIKEDDGEGNGKNEPTPPVDKELIREREYEVKTEEQRTVRQDVITRFWGSEVELTKAAYEKVNRKDSTETWHIEGITPDMTIKQIKDEIITLKLSGEDPDKLKALLGGFVNYVSWAKEAMVIEAMNRMKETALSEIKKKDETANAKVMD